MSRRTHQPGRHRILDGAQQRQPAETRSPGHSDRAGSDGARGGDVERGIGTKPDPASIPGSTPDSETAVEQRFLRAGVSRKTLAEIGSFLDREGVSFDAMTKIVDAGYYRGVELEQALAAYAIVIAACANQHVSPARGSAMRQHFLGGIEEGRVRFDVEGSREMAPSRPRYRYANNTIGAPEPGFDLSTIHARSLLLHEAQHVVQDARRDTNTPYAFERDGHDATAEYVLRASGALQREYGASTLDLNRAYAAIDVPHQAAIARRGKVWGLLDRYCLEAMVSVHVADALERDRLDLLRPRIDAESARRLIGDYTVEDFQELYLARQMGDPANAGSSRRTLDAEYRTPITRTGLR
jgi:hypothetical protein